MVDPELNQYALKYSLDCGEFLGGDSDDWGHWLVGQVPSPFSPHLGKETHFFHLRASVHSTAQGYEKRLKRFPRALLRKVRPLQPLELGIVRHLRLQDRGYAGFL